MSIDKIKGGSKMTETKNKIKNKNMLKWMDDLIEAQKGKVEKSKIDPIQLKLLDPKFDEETGQFDYAMFKNANKKEKNQTKTRILRLFRVKSVPSDIRVLQNNEESFKNILNDFAKENVSFVNLYAFKPGKNLMICYGVLTEIEKEKKNGKQETEEEAIERSLNESKNYIQALETKFRVAYRNVEIVNLEMDDDWVLEGFHYNHLTIARGNPKADGGMGAKTGSTPYGNAPQMGRQVVETILKGVTGKRSNETAQGFPFLMYTVFDKLDKNEVLRVMHEVNNMLGKLATSKQMAMSDSASFSMPMMMGMGFGEMFGESSTDTVGSTHSEAMQSSQTDTNTTGTAKATGGAEAYGSSAGQTEQVSNQNSSTQTNTKQAGWNQFVNIGGSEANANQAGLTESQGVNNSTSETTTRNFSDTQSQSSALANTRGETITAAQSEQSAHGKSSGQSENANIASGISTGDNSGVTRMQLDYFFETAVMIYSQYHERVYTSLRDGMYDYRMMVLTPDTTTKVIIEELIKQSYVDNHTPLPIQIEKLTEKEENELIQYARSMTKPMTLEKRVAIPDRYRFSTYITPREASAFNLPQVNLPGYNSSYDPVPESIAYFGEMEGEAKIGQQLYGAFNQKSPYPYTLKMKDLGHMGVFSMTGQGKTVFLQRFLSEVHNKFGLNVLLFDWTINHRTLVGHIKDPSKFRFGTFKQDYFMFKFNPLRTPPGVPQATWHATVAELFCHSMGLGDRSFRIIKKVLKKTKEKGVRLNKEATMKDFVEEIDMEFQRRRMEYEQNGLKMPFNEQETFASMKERIGEWVDNDHPVYHSMCDPGNEGFLKIEEMIDGDFVHLIECKHLPADVKKFVINIITAGIFHYCSSRNIKLKKPCYLVFEEAHAVLHTPTGKEPINVDETIFETINREARNYNLFIAYVCQSPEKLPELIFDNLPLRVVLQLPSIEGKEKIVAAGGRDPMRMDVDLVKWLSRMPVGTCLIRNSKFQHISEGEFAAVMVNPMYDANLDDEYFKQILIKNKKTS